MSKPNSSWIPPVGRACAPPRVLEDADGTHVVCTRHADVSEVLRHDELSVDRRRFPAFRRAAEALGHDPGQQMRSILVMDPPEHTEIRRSIHDEFTPRGVDGLEPRLRELAHELLDAAGDRFDLGDAFAQPFPARVIAELLGIDPEDHERFCRWSRHLTAPLVGDASPPMLEAAQRAERELAEFLLRTIAERRREPRRGLIADLVQASREHESLGDPELLALCRLLLVAGHETTTRAIAIGVGMLVADGDAWETLRNEPDAVAAAVEEVLRLATPIRAVARFAARDFEFAGAPVAKGARFTAWLDAANRDPDVFDAPGALRIDRDPNPHLAFGFGVHFCLGAALARLELRIALETLLERVPRLALVDDAPRWTPSPLVSDVAGPMLEASHG